MAFASVGAMIAVAPTAHSQIFTWSGGSASTSNWSAAANWLNGVAPSSSYANEIRMVGSARKTNNNDLGTRRMGKLVLDGSSWWLTGNAFEFQGGGTIESLGTNNLISNNLILNIAPNFANEVKMFVGAGNSMTLSGNISGAGRIAATGSGILNLNGTNTNTGGLIAYFGTVNAATSALGGALDIRQPARLNWNSAANTTFNHAITGTGTINKSGSGMLTLTGPSTFGGQWLITGGSISSMAANAFSGDVTFDTLSSAALRFDHAGDTSFAGNVATTSSGTPNHSIVKFGAGVLNLSGEIDDDVKLFVGGGTMKINQLSMTNRMEVTNGSNLELGLGGDVIDLTGDLSNGGHFVVKGPGTLNWTKAQTSFNGTTSADGSSLQGTASAFDDNNYRLVNGGEMRIVGPVGTFNGNLYNDGTVWIQNTTTNFTKAQNDWTGALRVLNATASISDNSVNKYVDIYGNGTVNYTSGGGIDTDFQFLGSGRVNFTGQPNPTRILKSTHGAFTGHIHVNSGSLIMSTANFQGTAYTYNTMLGLNQDFNGNFVGNIQGDGYFHKQGTGEVKVISSSALSNFTGDVVVQNGSLRLMNSTWNGRVRLEGEGKFVLDHSNNRSWTGTADFYSGNGRFVKDGTGTLSIKDNDISYFDVNKGTVLVDQGTLFSDELKVNQAGKIRMGGELSAIAGSTLNNEGEISGTGRIDSQINNIGTGRIITNAGDLINAQRDLTNTGAIQMTGGTVQVDQVLFNNAGGLISGRGVLRTAATTGVMGLLNRGAIAFSGGFTDVFGDLGNLDSGQIMTVGGGTTTFHDDVIHNGSEIRTASGSRSVFLGSLSGAGAFTGTGTVEIQGDLRPGNSPAHVQFHGDLELGQTATTTMEIAGLQRGAQYDSLTIGGTAMLGGVLDVKFIDGFSLTQGATFQLFSGNLTGTFSQMYLPTLQSGMWWDTSRLYTQGQLQAVPEPGTLIAVAMGLVAIGARRKRNRN